MLETLDALTAAWNEALGSLGVELDGAIVIGGGPAEAFGHTLPVRVSDEVHHLVTLGSAPQLGDHATPSATGLSDDEVDACVMLEAWADAREVPRVVAEARRITRPGGAIWLGVVDAERIHKATRATQRSALAYGAFPGLLSGVPDRSVADCPLALLRGGLKDIETWPVRLPIAAFDSRDTYAEAAVSGMWAGTELLSVAERSALRRAVLDELRGAEPPFVEHQPWIVARGLNPA